jgi:hypothetical protein
MNDEKAQFTTQLQTIKRLHPRPVTWRSRAHDLKIEWRTRTAVFKAGRTAQTPPIRFCVVAPGRTGSTLIFDLANSHPDVQCESNAKQTELLSNRFLQPRAFVEARAKLCPARAYGFKVKLNQLARNVTIEPQVFLQSMHDDGWKMIFLTRGNIFRQSLSLALARQTQVWHRVRDSDGTVKNAESGGVKTEKVELDIKLLLRILDYEELCHDCSKTVLRGIPHLKLEYEDDLFTAAQQSATMARVFDYLGLPPHPVSTCFERTGQDDWRAVLSNAPAVEAALRGTRFEHFIDAP